MTKEELKQEANLEASIMPWDEETDTWEDIAERAYIKGAEPREKRIAELEKENAELKTKKIPQLERKIASIRGAHSVDCKKLNARLEQVERLKKENTELRSQTSKAREILRGLYFIIQSRIDYENNTEIADEMWRAKQFFEGDKRQRTCNCIL